MRRCVIVGGGPIADYSHIREHLLEDDFFIFCDCGLAHRDGLNVSPDLIVGDFDSHPMPYDDAAEIITLPCEKDDTDTVFAAKEALKRGFKDFLLIGAAGGRLDHTLGNVSILLMLKKNGANGILLDDYSIMEIVGEEPSYIDDRYRFFSLINLFGTAKDIHITGAKYNIEKAEITCDYQYGISNEVAPGATAKVIVGEGLLLLVKILRE